MDQRYRFVQLYYHGFWRTATERVRIFQVETERRSPRRFEEGIARIPGPRYSRVETQGMRLNAG